MENENKNEMTEKKVGLIGKAKQKASGLVNYTDKDIQKLEKEAKKAYDEFYVADLAVRLLKDPQNEEILKEIAGLDEGKAKALKAILNRKKIRLAVFGGTIVVIGAAMAISAKKKRKAVVDVESEEVEDDSEEEIEEDDYEDEEESDEDSDDDSVEE